MKLIDHRRVWDKAPHCAFTDLLRFDDTWYCIFREGRDHWSPGAAGKVRIIRSADGLTWESAALFSGEGDLRDPKLCITPDNALMLIYFRRYNPHRYPDEDEQQFARFSDDAVHWSDPVKIGFPNRWLWRVVWHQGRAYGVSHGGPVNAPPFSSPRSGSVVVSDDGIEFSPLADAGHGGEATIRFAADGTACCLMRSADNKAWWCQSAPPYDVWGWKAMNLAIGGPDFIILPDDRMIAAVRLYDERQRTSVCRIDPASATLTEALPLPSGGDTSYSGLVFHKGELWVSYYSSHEEKTAIYLARIDPDR